MTITYANGQKIKGAMVVGDKTWMRLVLEGNDDVTEFTQVNGAWVSEDCEPVQIEFGWSTRSNQEFKEEDFVCSHELAAQLIHRLLNDEEEEDVTTPVPSPSMGSTAARLVV